MEVPTRHTHGIPASAQLLSCCLTLQVEEAKRLVRLAIHAGIMSDLGSGNNIDICVISREGAEYIRPYQESQYKDSRWAIGWTPHWSPVRLDYCDQPFYFLGRGATNTAPA